MAKPAKAVDHVPQATLGLRIPSELKGRIESAAAAQHRNVSQEVQRRLERSLDGDALLEDAIDLIRAGRGRLEAEPSINSVVWHALTEAYGRDVAEAAVEFIDWYQWSGQPVRGERSPAAYKKFKARQDRIYAAYRDNETAIANMPPPKRER